MKPGTPESRTETEDHYDALISAARGALEATPDLPPSRWVEMRREIDDAVSHEARGGLGWAWAAVGVAAAAAIVLSMRPMPAPHLPEVIASAPVAPPQVVEVVAPKAPATPAITAGQVLASGTQATTHSAFGRHHLTLAPGSELEVVDWTPKALVVTLREGSVTADIAKAFPGERVHIATANALVSVVGTQFVVALEEAGSTRVSVTEGIVEVFDGPKGLGEPVRLTAGATHVVPVVARGDGPKPPPARVRARKRVKAKPPAKPPAKDGFRIIEIDVPPQQAPNAR